MTMNGSGLVTLAGDTLEGVGVAVIVVCIAAAFLVSSMRLARSRSYDRCYRRLRQGGGGWVMRRSLQMARPLVGATLLLTHG